MTSKNWCHVDAKQETSYRVQKYSTALFTEVVKWQVLVCTINNYLYTSVRGMYNIVVGVNLRKLCGSVCNTVFLLLICWCIHICVLPPGKYTKPDQWIARNIIHNCHTNRCFKSGAFKWCKVSVATFLCQWCSSRLAATFISLHTHVVCLCSIPWNLNTYCKQSLTYI